MLVLVPLNHLYIYLGNGKSYVEKIYKLLKGTFVKNPKKKKSSNPIKKNSMSN